MQPIGSGDVDVPTTSFVLLQHDKTCVSFKEQAAPKQQCTLKILNNC